MGRTSILAKIAANILTGGRRTTAVNTRDVLNEMANSYVSAIYDTAANFTSSNPILETKQLGIETNDLTTSPKFKIGNGITAWNSLPYAGGASATTTIERFEVTGTTITLANTPISIVVFKNGQLLNGSATGSYAADFSRSGVTITLATAADADLFQIINTH